MKKRLTKIIISALAIFIATLAAFVVAKIISSGHKSPVADIPQFSLDQTYYDEESYSVETSAEELDVLIAKKSSFVVYVSLPLCSGETAMFRDYVNEFQRENSITFLYMNSDTVKDTPIYDTVKYYPSVILYKDGELVKYLRADSNEDSPYYKSLDGFTTWLTTYVKLAK